MAWWFILVIVVVALAVIAGSCLMALSDANNEDLGPPL